ncbi:MAG TPA: hypothetical protein VL598_09415 [Trinickia sp.]|jgi:hypothetical protein|nr:hypothetical protein [Trinickia sp.]HTI17871.1 hypothetical protein [Trinickia sp.]
MKAWIAAVLAAWICAACAQGGPSSYGPQGGSVTMYGTVDTGVTVKN